jgi:hypothetical protein
MSLRNTGWDPATAQSKQHEYATKECQQNDTDEDFEGMFTKEASKLIQQLEESSLRPHVCHCYHHYVFPCDSDRRPSVVTRPTNDHHKPLPRVGQPLAVQTVWQSAVCETLSGTT